MSDWVESSIGSLFSHSFSGEWGSEPDGAETDARVYRGADFNASGRFGFDAGVPRKISKNKLKKVRLKDGDILLEKSGGSPDQPVGRVSMYSGTHLHAASSNFLQTLRPRVGVDPEFLLYLLQHEYHSGRVLPFQQQTTGLINFRLKDYLKETVEIPADSREQRRIAELLSTLDEQIAHTAAEVGKLQLIRKAVIRGSILGTQLNQAWPFGHLSANWPISNFGTEFDLQLGKMLSKAAKTGRDELPYIGNRSVQWGHIELGSLETMYFSPRERSKYCLLKGDLLICEGGEIGRSAIWQGAPFVCHFQKAVHRARALSSAIKPEFAYLILELAADLGWFTNYVAKTSIAHLPREKLTKFPLPMPSRDEQDEICSAVDSANDTLEASARHLAKLELLNQGLMRSLLTGEARLSC